MIRSSGFRKMRGVGQIKQFYSTAEDDTAYNFSKELTSSFIIGCGVSTRQQRVDSFFVHGWLKILS